MLTMAVAVLLMTSCSKKPAGQMLVSEDAAIVFKIDPLQMGQKCGLSGSSDGNAIADKLKSVLNVMGLSKDLRERLEDIIDEPSQSGIDITEPMYLSVTLRNSTDMPTEIGLMGTIGSKGKLTDLLKALSKESGGDMPEVENINGVSCLSVGFAGLYFTSDWFFIGTHEGDDDDFTAELNNRAAGKGTLEGNEAFTAMCQKDGMAQMLYLGAGVAKITEMTEIKDMLPKGMDLADFAGIIELDADNGEMSIVGQAIGLTDEAKQYITDSFSMLGSLDTELNKYVSGQGLSIFANLDLSKYFKTIEGLLATQGIEREDLDMVKGLIDTVKGAMVLDLSGMANGYPCLTAYMATDNSDIVDLLATNFEEEDGFEKTGDNSYKLIADYDYEYAEDGGDEDNIVSTPVWAQVGYDKNISYFTYNTDVEPMQKPAKSFAGNMIKGKGIYLNFNFDMLRNIPDISGDLSDLLTKTLDYVEFYMDGDKSVLRLVTKETGETPLQTLFRLASQAL